VYTGSVYVYGSVGNIWSRQSKILAVDGAARNWLGHGVSIYGTMAMIGAHGDDDKASYAGINEDVTNDCYTKLLNMRFNILIYL
jgi:hypothetical protein